MEAKKTPKAVYTTRDIRIVDKRRYESHNNNAAHSFEYHGGSAFFRPDCGLKGAADLHNRCLRALDTVGSRLPLSLFVFISSAKKVMKSFRLHEVVYEKGKCRKCGVGIPDRFFNPYYCWNCFRLRMRKIAFVVTGIVMTILFAALFV